LEGEEKKGLDLSLFIWRGKLGNYGAFWGVTLPLIITFIGL